MCLEIWFTLFFWRESFDPVNSVFQAELIAVKGMILWAGEHSLLIYLISQDMLSDSLAILKFDNSNHLVTYIILRLQYFKKNPFLIG